jgi:hypothetical protein
VSGDAICRGVREDRTRTIPPSVRRALHARDKHGCRFPGCTNKHYVDGHHIRHWANGGETRLSNLVLLCRFHHRQVHERGVMVEVLDDGALRFVVKNGRSFDSPVPARQAAERDRPNPDGLRGNWSQLVAQLSDGGIVITPDTAATRWRGERMDYGAAIDVLLSQTHRAASSVGVSAETPTRAESTGKIAVWNAKHGRFFARKTLRAASTFRLVRLALDAGPDRCAITVV